MACLFRELKRCSLIPGLSWFTILKAAAFAVDPEATRGAACCAEVLGDVGGSGTTVIFGFGRGVGGIAPCEDAGGNAESVTLFAAGGADCAGGVVFVGVFAFELVRTGGVASCGRKLESKIVFLLSPSLLSDLCEDAGEVPPSAMALIPSAAEAFFASIALFKAARDRKSTR